jgi:hypothetical protein
MTFNEWLKTTNGDYYACNDPEELSHEDAVEAILEHVDGFGFTEDEDFAEYWRSEDISIDVTAYSRKAVSENEMKRWSDQALEYIAEGIDEEYGNPNGDGGTVDVAKFEERMLALVREIVKETHVWACERESEYTLSVEEVIELVRKERPEWFKNKGDEVPE